MKRFLTIFCITLAILVVSQQVIAQPKHGITFREVWYNNYTPIKSDYKFFDIYSEVKGRGFGIDYNYRLDKHTWLVVPAKIGLARVYRNETSKGTDKLLGNLDVLLQNNLFKYGNLINPTIHVGVGSTWNIDDDKFRMNIPAGVGMNIRLMENFYVNLQSQYRFSIDDKSAWHHSVGAVLYFGDEKPKDRDGDGIMDPEDKCPDVPGVAALMGCPDKDGDGITDSEDKCPDVAGVAALMGCPDKDGDGIADMDDMCPEEKGLAAFKGCPDTDNDGIADKDDKCPRVAGPVSLKGCPDKDGDGITDADDACPDQKGPVSTKGCPDKDSDGVADKDDACPDKKGDPMHKGCPDTDKDGTYDDTDRCIDKPGPPTNFGCPEIKKEDKQKIELAIKLVQFETGKDVLLPKSKKTLDDVADVLNRYPDYNLSIAGHTDNQGDDAKNLDLSKRRAKTCFDYLVSKGVAATRLTSEGYGETKPVADNATAAGRELNRRVEFELMLKK